jgi:hypothetical protein
MIKQMTFMIMLLGITSTYAQLDGTSYVSRDFSTRTEAAFKLRITKGWSITVSEQLQLKQNSSKLDAFFTELGTKYKFKSGIALGIAYRVIGENNGSGVLDWEQRFHGDISYEYKVKRFGFNLRLRGQSRDDYGEKKADGDYARRALRLRLELNYDIKNWKFDPVVSTEIFLASEKYVRSHFNKIRATIGTSYKFKKAGELSAFYRFEKDLGTDYALSNHIIGIQYKFTYKAYKNGKKK